MKAIVFDRDGTLVEFVNFLHKIEEVRINKDIIPTFKYLINRKNIKFFMHTNQSGICRNMFDLSEVNSCNRRFLKLLKKEYNIQISFEQIYIASSFNSIYRKPTKAVVTELQRNFNLKKENILYIGDTKVDFETSKKSKTKCLIYRGYAAKPLYEKLSIEDKYLAYNGIELLEKVKHFINESND